MNTKPRQGKNILVKIAAVLIFLMAIAAGAYQGWKYREAKKAEYLSGKNIVYRMEDVLGVQTATASVTVDFGKQIATGSPLVFGGAHAPKLEHQDAWNKIADAGITMIRSDFFMEFYIPSNITLEEYKSNKNNVQDPSTWNQQKIKEKNDIYLNAKNRGMKAIGILAYVPKWLTYTNTIYGVPKDWEVFKDLVKKSYTIHRPYVDIVEIWNEPDANHFLNLTGSNISRETAYIQMALNAIRGMKEVDASHNDQKKILKCIPTISNPADIRLVDAALSVEEIRNGIDCISYHSYGEPEEPSFRFIRPIMTKYGIPDKPIFITEWARNYKMNIDDPYVTGNPALLYSSRKLLTYLKNGIAGANYFQLKPITPNSTRGDEGYLGFYTWNGKKAELLPISRTFTLFSKTLQLGKGLSQLFSTKMVNLTDSVGLINYQGIYEVILYNAESIDKTVSITLTNYPADRKAIKAYGASSRYDGKKLIGQNKLNTSNFQAKIFVPAETTIGLILTSR